MQKNLLNFSFLVDHMLAYHWVKLLDLHFVRHGLLIFAGRVEVTGASGRYNLILSLIIYSLLRDPLAGPRWLLLLSCGQHSKNVRRARLGFLNQRALFQARAYQ